MRRAALKHLPWMMLVSVLEPSPARADPDTRLNTGLAVTPFWSGTAVTVSGKKWPEGQTAGAGWELGASRTVLGRIFAVRGTARIGTWESNWSGEREERRGHFDIDLGPELRIPFPAVAAFRASVPFGYSKAWIHSSPGRAVRDDYTGGHGVTFGLVMALEMFGEHHGGYFGMSYLSRMHWFDHETELIADPSVKATERYRFKVDSAVFQGGYAFRF